MIYSVPIPQPDDLAAFRHACRRLLPAGIAPSEVIWSGSATLFSAAVPGDEKALFVPRCFSTLADAVACHREDIRWSLLYQALWRIARGERSLMEQVSDPLVHRLNRMATAIKRDQHRMTAFVRFRKVYDADGELFLAWYEPQHRVLRRTAAFFTDRFTNMRFSIVTPDLTLHWDRGTEAFAPGLAREEAVSTDAVETWWRQYYAATFNPARANVRLMVSHMPKRFWRDLPEASCINGLIEEANSRTEQMIRKGGARRERFPPNLCAQRTPRIGIPA